MIYSENFVKYVYLKFGCVMCSTVAASKDVQGI